MSFSASDVKPKVIRHFAECKKLHMISENHLVGQLLNGDWSHTRNPHVCQPSLVNTHWLLVNFLPQDNGKSILPTQAPTRSPSYSVVS